MAATSIVFRLTLEDEYWSLALEQIGDRPADDCIPDDRWVPELIKDEDLDAWELAPGHRYKCTYTAHSYRTHEGDYDVETEITDVEDLGPLEVEHESVVPAQGT